MLINCTERKPPRVIPEYHFYHTDPCLPPVPTSRKLNEHQTKAVFPAEKYTLEYLNVEIGGC